MKSTHFILAALFLAVAACGSTPETEISCDLPEGYNLDNALSATRADLTGGCEQHFERYLDKLLQIAAEDPNQKNKEKFSDFLLWANQSDLISKNQARDYYNRYFGVKYISLKSDYSVCSETCPQRQVVLNDMRSELLDKETGLAKVSADQENYQRANQLYREVELVLNATCNACGLE